MMGLLTQLRTKNGFLVQSLKAPWVDKRKEGKTFTLGASLKIGQLCMLCNLSFAIGEEKAIDTTKTTKGRNKTTRVLMPTIKKGTDTEKTFLSLRNESSGQQWFMDGRQGTISFLGSRPHCIR